MLTEPGARLVTAACALLGLVGLVFGVTSAVGGAGRIAFLFLSMPVLALATWQTRRWARTPLVLVSALTLPALATGVLGSANPFAWPTVLFLGGAVAVAAGVVMLISDHAKKWFAITAAHRVLSEPKR
jgi:hypothetical protein